MADYPDEPPFVRKQILYGMLHTFLLKDGVQVGNVSLVMEIDSHQPLVIIYPQEGITAQIDMVEALVLFQRIYIFGGRLQRGEVGSIIQIDVLGGGKYHSSVRKLEDIAYLVITQTVRGVNGSE